MWRQCRSIHCSFSIQHIIGSLYIYRLLATKILGEPFFRADIAGIICVIIGSVLAVIFGPRTAGNCECNMAQIGQFPLLYDILILWISIILSPKLKRYFISLPPIYNVFREWHPIFQFSNRFYTVRFRRRVDNGWAQNAMGRCWIYDLFRGAFQLYRGRLYSRSILWAEECQRSDSNWWIEICHVVSARFLLSVGGIFWVFGLFIFKIVYRIYRILCQKWK